MPIPVNSGTTNLGELSKQHGTEAANRGAALEETKHKAVFLKGELTKSKAGNDMAVLIFDSKTQPGKKIKKRFVFADSTAHQIAAYTNTMERMGVDVNKIKKPSDWERSFLDLADEEVKTVMDVWYKDDDKEEDGTIKKGAYPEIDLWRVALGLNGVKEDKSPFDKDAQSSDDAVDVDADAERQKAADEAAQRKADEAAAKKVAADKKKAEAEAKKAEEAAKTEEPEPTPETEAAPSSADDDLSGW